MLSYDLDDFKGLLHDISTLIEATVTFFDDNHNSTSAYGRNDRSSFCFTLKNNGYFGNCMQSDSQAFNNFPENATSYYHRCHFGFIEIIFKLIIEGEMQGYVMMGPFRDEKLEKEQLKKIKAHCERTGLDYNEQAKKFKEITIFSEEKYNAVTRLFSSLINYAQEQNLLTVKTTLFTNKIEPYIFEHLHEDLSNEVLQKVFFLSEKQLYSVFLTSTKKTPKQYINKQRIIQAKNLIITTDLPLPKISSSVGFNDYNYFIKVFKKYEGYTPLHFRKQKD